MAEFLTRKQTASWVEKIIIDAKNHIVLISPYLQLSDDLLARLKNTDKRVEIKIIYRADEELKPNQIQRLKNEIQRLEQLKNLSLASLKNLHAKCYYNEECMVITSMNLYDYSERNNWEMGLLILQNEDEKVFAEAKKEAESIIRESTKVKSRESLADKFGRLVGDLLTEEKSTGNCIGCGKDMIPYNKDHPICSDCWKRRVRRGHLCYKCGKEWQTTQKKPLCDSCYDRSQR